MAPRAGGADRPERRRGVNWHGEEHYGRWFACCDGRAQDSHHWAWSCLKGITNGVRRVARIDVWRGAERHPSAFALSLNCAGMSTVELQIIRNDDLIPDYERHAVFVALEGLSGLCVFGGAS
jgi:hypothetical protein